MARLTTGGFERSRARLANVSDFGASPASVTGLGGTSRSGGASSTTLALTGLTIPASSLILVWASCGLNAANTISCADDGGTTYDTEMTFNNTGPNPDRLSSFFRGMSDASPGSAITVTFPGSVSEAMMAAVAVQGVTSADNGNDQILQNAGPDNASAFVVTLAGATKAVLGFVWSSGTGITSSDALAELVNHDGGYHVSVYRFANGDTSVNADGGGGGGQMVAHEFAFTL